MSFQLVIRTGADAGHHLELNPGRYRLGRGSDSDFIIDDTTVSSTHCEITVDEQVRVRDFGSTNGTFIDGKRIIEGVLGVGQTLRLGDVEAVLQVPVTITVPKVDFSAPPPPPPLEDGSLACLNHPSVAATFMCLDCEKSFCVPCVHKVRRIGGHLMILCPICSAHCQLVPGKEAIKPQSIFGRLVKTLKLRK
jgi:hypothetical protein